MSWNFRNPSVQLALLANAGDRVTDLQLARGLFLSLSRTLTCLPELGSQPTALTGQLGSRALRPTPQSYGSAISQWQNSLLLLRECQSQMLESTVILYNSVISSLEPGGWLLAVNLFYQLLTNGLNCTSITYNAGIAAFSQAWRRAQWSFKEIQLMDLRHSVVSYSSLITSIASKKHSWSDGLEILVELCREDLQPNVVTFTSAIATERWNRALALYTACGKKQANWVDHGAATQRLFDTVCV